MRSENHQHHQHHSHHHHHNFYHHNLHIHQRSIFLPMLCSRPSIKDVNLPQCSSRDPPESFSNDPLSPRIGCTGQVKRHNKITPRLSFSHRLTFTPKSGSSSTSTTTTPSPILKYSKLKRLFSGKSLINTSTTTTAASASSCGSSRPRVVTVKSGDVQKKHRCSRNENLLVAISIENMDPPLPVIKRVHKCDEEGSKVESLWKRRFGGAAALKSLQIQQIQHPRHHLQLTSAFDG